VAGRYAAAVHVDRPDHLLLPGLVDVHAQICPVPGHGPGSADRSLDALARVAQMLSSGTTCFCGVGFHPDESARVAVEQGMRAVIGMPIAAEASPWAGSPGEYMTRALAFRDEYRGHPFIATVFAPHGAASIPDATLLRIATLADELDAGIVMPLHESPAEIADSQQRHGLRPIARLQSLGLLTPALTAAQMVHVEAAEVALATRSGIAVGLCPDAALRAGYGLPPIATWSAAGLRLGLGSGATAPAIAPNPWNDIRLATLFAAGAAAEPAAWNALGMATRGGAAALGLETQIGTLERGKWADLCCLDARGPAMHGPACASPRAALAQWILDAGRDTVSDVWVAGRHLLNEQQFTRLDWPRLAARLRAPAAPTIDGAPHANCH
jgi:5-methylthioadenosine/S-adenosylhomocysteine deaminase